MNFFKRGFKAAKSALFGDDAGDTDSDDGYDSNRRGGGGFTHKKQVVVERTKIPVVQYAVSMYGGEPMGGIQGLWWYAKSLLCDADGDVANQFLEEPQLGRGGGGGGGSGTGRGSEASALGGRGDRENEGHGEEEEVNVRYSHALVEVKEVSKGNVLLCPRNLD